jgi:hypothetical protein
MVAKNGIGAGEMIALLGILSLFWPRRTRRQDCLLDVFHRQECLCHVSAGSVRRGGGGGMELHQAHVRFRDGAVVAVAEADDADTVAEADGRGVRERLIDHLINGARYGGVRQPLDGPVEGAGGGDVPAIAAVQATELAGFAEYLAVLQRQFQLQNETPGPGGRARAGSPVPD